MVTIAVPLREPARDAYDIRIGHGLLAELPPLLSKYCPAQRYAVVSDSHVGGLYGRAVVQQLEDAGVAGTELLTFPAGERSKTRDTWADLSDRMLAAGLGRDTAVVALGGGVVGDVAGFVAATYLRGVPWVIAPTTLLAMIDASVGGKTGIDAPAGKNLLGAFHQPRVVVMDLDTLTTLPAVQLTAGVAEAIKHGVVADAAYFDFVAGAAEPVRAKDPGVLERIVARSVAIKAAIVASDEREAGRRAVLNFGHTLAHAIEAVMKYEVAHGEAVAIGLALEARLAERVGVAETGTARRIADALLHYGLPIERPTEAAVHELLGAMRRDKKVRAGEIRFALPRAIGRMHGADSAWTIAVRDEEVRAVLT